MIENGGKIPDVLPQVVLESPSTATQHYRYLMQGGCPQTNHSVFYYLLNPRKRKVAQHLAHADLGTYLLPPWQTPRFEDDSEREEYHGWGVR